MLPAEDKLGDLSRWDYQSIHFRASNSSTRIESCGNLMAYISFGRGLASQRLFLPPMKPL